MPSHCYSYLGWEDAFPGAVPPVDGVAFYLRRLPKIWLLETLGKIGTTLYNSGAFSLNRNQQIAFLQSFKNHVPYVERLVRFISRNPSRPFAHADIVAALTKQALLHGADGGSVPSFAYDHLLRAIALMNSAYGRTRLVGDGSPEDFLPYELEIMLQNHENFSFMMGRYFRFIQWAARQLPEALNYTPIAADFPSFFGGLSYDEYVTAGVSLASRFMAQLDLGAWRDQCGIADMSEWLLALRDKAPVSSRLSSASLDIVTAVHMLAARADSFGLADLRPFIDQPLLKVAESKFACPHQGFFRNKLGEGTYYGLFDGYKRRDGDKAALKFAQFFGRFLEEHVFELVRDGLSRRLEALVFPEQVYRTPLGESRSSDVSVVVGPIAIFIEVTRGRFPLDTAICDRDPGAVAKAIEQIFVKKATQLDRCIKDFRRGAFRLADVEADSIERIFPIILTEQKFPQFIALPRLIRGRLRAKGLLTDCDDVQLFSAEDIEFLHLDADGAMDLEGILARKAASPYVHRDLTTYLYDCEREKVMAKPNSSASGYSELWHDIVYPKTREWGLGL